MIDYDRDRKDSTKTQFLDAVESTERARRRRNLIATRLDLAKGELNAAQENFLVGACELFVWSIFKERVVKPEVQRAAGLILALSDDQIAQRFTDKEVEERFERGRSLLDNVTQASVGHEQLAALGRRTLSLLQHPDQFLAESLQIAALASPAERARFVHDAESRLMEHGYHEPQRDGAPNPQELRSASRSGQTTVPPPCLEIAEQLGLFSVLKR